METVISTYWPESSSVTETHYFPRLQILEVKFKGAKSYSYLNFPPEKWDELNLQKVPGNPGGNSIGKYISTQVKPNYKLYQVPPCPANGIQAGQQPCSEPKGTDAEHLHPDGSSENY